MILENDTWRNNLARTLNRIIAGAGVIAVAHLCIAALFLTISLAGPPSDSAINVIPIIVGSSSSALLSGSLLVQAIARRASLARGASFSTNSQRAAVRLRPLAYLGAAGLVITILSGLFVAYTAAEHQAVAWAGVGCIFHLQPWVMIWSATRMLTRARSESIAAMGA